MLLPNGSIKIIDRAKNIFKLCQGEYIAPEKLEGVYQQSPFIQDIFVHGDSLQSFLVAIVVPEYEAIEAHYKKLGNLNYTVANPIGMCESEEVKDLILKSMNQLAQENKFNGLEKPKKLHLCPREFVKENPEMITPSFKMKRNVGTLHFRSQINFMYSG